MLNQYHIQDRVENLKSMLIFSKLVTTTIIGASLSLIVIDAGLVQAAKIGGSFRIRGDWGGLTNADVSWTIDKHDPTNANGMNTIIFDDGLQKVTDPITAFTLVPNTWDIETMQTFGGNVNICLGLACRKIVNSGTKVTFIEGPAPPVGLNEISRIKSTGHCPINKGKRLLSYRGYAPFSNNRKHKKTKYITKVFVSDRRT